MNRTKKYMTRIGQYTGTSKACENEQNKAISVARVADSLCHVNINEQRAYENQDVPKLPFRQPADEWPEFVVALGWKGARIFPSTFYFICKQIFL